MFPNLLAPSTYLKVKYTHSLTRTHKQLWLLGKTDLLDCRGNTQRFPTLINQKSIKSCTTALQRTLGPRGLQCCPEVCWHLLPCGTLPIPRFFGWSLWWIISPLCCDKIAIDRGVGRDCGARQERNTQDPQSWSETP